MAYVGVLLLAILVSFIIVRIGAFALQLTGMEPEAARFQALSAFSGTGFTTTEAERVVRSEARRRIITVLIILGNAGLVTIIATLVLSFSQVTGYGWFFIRLGMIIAGVIILYQLVIRSRFGSRILEWFRKPLMNSIMRQAPAVEEVFHVGKDWGINLITVKDESKNIGLSLAEFTAQAEAEVLAVERDGAFLYKPDKDDKIVKGDRLLVYGQRKSVARLAG